MHLFLCLLTAGQLAFPQFHGDVSQFVTVTPSECKGTDVQYYPIDSGLTVFPAGLLADKKTTVVLSGKAGAYRLLAWSSIDGKPTPGVVVTITIGKPAPHPDNPKPDEPKPDEPKPDEPKPDTPAPIAKPGLRVMVVYDSTKLSTMPKDQQTTLFSTELRNWMNENCVKDANGAAEWRIYPQVTNVSESDVVWQEAMKRPRTTVPWILISNGKTGFEGPLPATLKDTADLLKKYKE